MQSFEIEFLVAGSLDGVTPSPAFITKDRAPSTPKIDPESLETDVAEPDDDNIYRFDVENLGLVDPDFGLGGTFGDRFIVGLWINSPNPAADPAPIAVVSTRVRELTQEIVVDNLAGLDNFYREECIFIPQGSYLGFIGFAADPGTPILVRMHVKCPQTLEEYALLLNSCCCTELAACTTPTVDSISPQVVDCNDPPPQRTVTVKGGPFNADTQASIVAICVGPGGMSITDIEIVDEETLTFLVNCSGVCTPATLTISNGPGCEVTVPDAFSTTDE